MRLMIIPTTKLSEIKDDTTKFFKGVQDHRNSIDWIREVYGNDALKESEYDFDFTFDMSTADPKDSDYTNAVKLYEYLNDQGVPPAVLFSEQFLVGFLLTYGYEYVIWRWGLAKETIVSDHWLFAHGQRRSIAENAIGRLYLRVMLSYDESNDDPYEYTQFAFEYPEMTKQICWKVYADNTNVSLAYFKAMKKYADKYDKLQKDGVKLLDETNKQLSYICSVCCGDIYDREELANKLFDYMESL